MKKRIDPDTINQEELTEKMKERAEEIFSVPPMENEPTVLTGSPETLYSSDSEEFPSDLAEYKPEEKKLKVVKNQ